MADSSSISTNLSTNATITGQVATVINWLTFGIGLPAIALAMYALKNMSRGWCHPAYGHRVEAQF